MKTSHRANFLRHCNDAEDGLRPGQETVDLDDILQVSVLNTVHDPDMKRITASIGISAFALGNSFSPRLWGT